MLKFKDNVWWSLRQIKTRLLESILIILGIGLGIAVICSVIGLIDGYRERIENFSNDLHARVLNLMSVENTYQPDMLNRALIPLGSSVQEKVKLTIKDYYSLKDADLVGVERIWAAQTIGTLPKGQKPPELDSFEERRQWEEENVLRFCRATPEVFDIAKLNLIKGDIFREKDLVDRTTVAVLGKKIAKRLFTDEDPIGQKVSTEWGDYTVIGVVETEFNEAGQYIPGIGSIEILDNIIYIPYTCQIFNHSYEEDIRVYILMDEDVNLERCYNNIRNYIKTVYGNMIVASGSFTYYMQSAKQVTTLGTGIGIFASIAMLIAAVNILNLMLARVFKRYKQVGIAMALGAGRRDVFRLFITEAIVLGLCGSILGIILSFGASYLLESLIHQPIKISLLTGLTGVGTALFISLVFGVYPASLAARTNSVDALRTE